MKTISTFLAVIIALAASVATANIGYIDMQKALQTVEAGRNAKESLEKEVQSKKGELEKQQQAFQKEAESFEKKAAIMNDSAKGAKQAELQKKYVELQKMAAESQMELQKRERELTKPIVDELKSIVETLGKEKKFEMVLEKNEGAVIYAEANLDLTSQAIEKFNSKNKGKRTSSSPEKKKK